MRGSKCVFALLFCFALAFSSSAQSVEPLEPTSGLWSLLNQKLDDLQNSFDQQAKQIDFLQNQLTEDRLLLTKQSESLAQAQTYSLILERSLSSSRKLNRILGWAGGVALAIAIGEGIALSLR